MNKENKRLVYLLFACDEWKGKDSMRLVSVAVVPTKIRQAVEWQIRLGNMTYKGDTNKSAAAQVREFRSDWKTKTRNVLNDNLCGGFLDTMYEGEEY